LTVIETVLFATDLSWLLLAFAASDFHEWLLEASEKAEGSFSLAEFFARLRSDA